MISDLAAILRKHLIAVATIVLAVGGLSRPAQAEVAGISRGNLSIGAADFGSGFHAAGGPTGPYTITWDYTNQGGTINVTARVQGTLYVDALGAHRARVRIFYQTSDFSDLFEDVDSLCGPGGNANAAANQKLIDKQFTHPSLRRVLIVTGAGGAFVNPFTGVCAPFGEMDDIVGEGSSAPRVSARDTFSNGNADFGGQSTVSNLHLFGNPPCCATMSLILNDNGRIEGRVLGTLYWDNSLAGTARLQIRFRDVNNNNLTAVRQIDETGPFGGNALQASNQTAVDQRFTSASLFKIRVSVGFPSGADGITGAMSETYSLGPSVGTSEGVPFRNITRVNEETTFGFRWIVPDPQNWHSLDTLIVRLTDEQGEVLRVRWNEADNLFSQFNPNTARFSAPASVGSARRFETPAVTLLLDGSEVIGSGPTGPSVLLNLNFKFKPQAAGRTFNVEVQARDDSGETQEWDLAGRITVLPEGR